MTVCNISEFVAYFKWKMPCPVDCVCMCVYVYVTAREREGEIEKKKRKNERVRERVRVKIMCMCIYTVITVNISGGVAFYKWIISCPVECLFVQKRDREKENERERERESVRVCDDYIYMNKYSYNSLQHFRMCCVLQMSDAVST